MLDQLQFPTTAQTLGERRFHELRHELASTNERIAVIESRIKALSGLLAAKLNEILDAVAKLTPASVESANPAEPEARAKPSPSRAARMRPDSAPVVRATWYQPPQANTRPVSIIYVHRKLIDLAELTAEDRFQVWIDGDVLVIARNPVGRLANKWTDGCVSIRSTDIGRFEMPETPAEVSPGVIRVRIPSARP